MGRPSTARRTTRLSGSSRWHRGLPPRRGLLLLPPATCRDRIDGIPERALRAQLPLRFARGSIGSDPDPPEEPFRQPGWSVTDAWLHGESSAPAVPSPRALAITRGEACPDESLRRIDRHA